MGALEAGQCVAMLATAYPNSRLEDPSRSELWIRFLADLPPDVLQAAVSKLIATSTFCPSIAEVRAAAVEVAAPEVSELTAGEGWAQVIRAIASVGYYAAPRFQDPIVERALQCTATWQTLCTATNGEMSAHRARYIQAFESLQHKMREGAMLPESLHEQIAACRKETYAGVLDDAKEHLGLPTSHTGMSRIAAAALAQAQAELDGDSRGPRAARE